MKRIIFILWAVLASGGWLMANHWTPNGTPYEDNMTLTGFVRIDNVEQQTTALEVGAFCGEECRGSAQLTFFYPAYRYVVQMVIYGNIDDQLTFRLYDHEIGEELDLITYDTVTFTGNSCGSLAEPYMLNFYNEPPGPHTVTVWADPEQGGIVTGSGIYSHGDTATLTATANEDYVFAYWAKDGQIVSESATFSVVVIEPGDYEAHFDLSITHHWTPTVTSFEDNMTLTGVIQINGVEQQNPMLEVGVFCGEECRGSATPTLFEPTYRYVVQLLIYGETGEQLTFRLYDHEQNTELDLYPTHTVTFSSYGYGSLAAPYILDFTGAATEVHTITATVNLEGNGTVEGTGSYLHGTTCTLEAIPSENYAFDNWTENGALVSTSSTYAFEVTESRSLVANFVPVESNHWTPNTAPYEDNMTLTGIVQINFVEQQTTAIEVGAFCGEECRGAGRLAFFQPTQQYVIQLVVYGNIGDSLTFKLFDHRQNAELDLVAPEAIMLTESGYGSLANPYVLSFLEIYEVATVANPAEGGTMTGAGTYSYFSTCTLTATANTGYHFLNWTFVGEVVSNSPTYSFEVTGPASYVANFEINSYNITVEANPEAGGTVTGAGEYNHFDTCTLMATANEGYHFVNWTHVGEVVSNSPTYTFEVTGAADYVANFELNSYEITASANPTEDGTVTGAGEYNHFDTCTLTATANVGYHFVNWTHVGEVVSNSPTYSFEVTGPASYVANFEINSYNITVTANPEAGGTVTGAGEYNHFDTCTLTATANEGYHFVNWTHVSEVVSNSPTYTFEVTSAADYVANFELYSYDITAEVNPAEGGTISGTGTYDHFSTCTLTATASIGYHFVNWTHVGEVVSNSPTYSFEVTAPATYVANFEINSYNITVEANPEAGGTVTGAGEYNHFDTCTLTATANTGYHFVNWTHVGEVVSNSPTYTFEVTGAADYVANFELNSYEITVTVNPTEGGTVTGAGEYNHFDTCTLTATANVGYHFVSWTHVGEVVSNSPTYSFEVTGPASYVANFEINSYNITVEANPEAGGTVTGAGEYNHFDTCTLTATANTGYHFLNWTHVGEVVSNSPTYSFEVTGAADYVANFELNSYEITVTVNPTEGGTVTGAGVYYHFDTCTLVATANENYAFLNWTLVGEVVSNSPTYSFTVTEAADYVANFELTTITQSTDITLGWNWWSTYVEADDLFAQLKTGLGANAHQIKSSTSFVNYFNGMWVGGLYGISNESCYLIQATTPCMLEMTGTPAAPANHPITINPNWNWIGYPNTNSMTVANAFSNFGSANGDQVKSQNAFSTYFNGMWVGGLQNITPGMGLLYKSNSSETKTLIYPEANRSEELAANVTNESNHWTADYHAYPSNMTVMAVVELDDMELQGDNYELAAFADGECRGSARLMYVEPLNRYMAFLTVVGDEASELRFSLYDSETGIVETQDFASLQYETNATIGSLETPYVICFRSTTGIDEWGNNINIFPNPVNRGGKFSLVLLAVEALRATSVQIVNAMGVVVETWRAASLQTIKAPDVAGVYTLRISVEGKGTCIRKLIVK